MVMSNEVNSASTFIFGGNAEFTIRNVESGNGYKYKVRKGKLRQNDKNEVFFVKVKNGQHWEYAGYVVRTATAFFYNQGKRGTLPVTSPAIKGLVYALNKGANPLPAPMTMTHHGRCAHCGRKLDDEVSVARGFGPVCWKQMNM